MGDNAVNDKLLCTIDGYVRLCRSLFKVSFDLPMSLLTFISVHHRRRQNKLRSMYKYMYTNMNTNLWKCNQRHYIYTYIYIYIHMYVYIYICICLYEYTYMNVYMQMLLTKMMLCTFVHVRIYVRRRNRDMNIIHIRKYISYMWDILHIRNTYRWKCYWGHAAVHLCRLHNTGQRELTHTYKIYICIWKCYRGRKVGEARLDFVGLFSRSLLICLCLFWRSFLTHFRGRKVGEAQGSGGSGALFQGLWIAHPSRLNPGLRRLSYLYTSFSAKEPYN